MRSKGFSLAELFMASVIMLLVAAGSMTVYLLSYSGWRESSGLAALQRTGSMAMEKMVRGVRGNNEARRNGLREAKSFSIPNAGTILFTSGVDSVERRFYLSADKIIYRCGGGESTLAHDVDSLAFSKIANKRIRIDVTLQEEIKGKTISVNLESEVLIRN